jgi:hypothetical protein
MEFRNVGGADIEDNGMIHHFIMMGNNVAKPNNF